MISGGYSKIIFRSFTFIVIAMLIFIILLGQVYAAPIQPSSTNAKLTPSPTFDPVQNQGSSTSITIASVILMLIVLISMAVFLLRARS